MRWCFGSHRAVQQQRRVREMAHEAQFSRDAQSPPGCLNAPNLTSAALGRVRRRFSLFPFSHPSPLAFSLFPYCCFLLLPFHCSISRSALSSAKERVLASLFDVPSHLLAAPVAGCIIPFRQCCRSSNMAVHKPEEHKPQDKRAIPVVGKCSRDGCKQTLPLLLSGQLLSPVQPLTPRSLEASAVYSL